MKVGRGRSIKKFGPRSFWMTPYTLFYHIEPQKNGASPSLPSSITRNSLAPNAKRIFEFLWGILKGRTIRAQPSRPFLKNCQNGTFWSVHGIWNFFGPNDFIWGAIKVPYFDFIPKISQAPSSSVQLRPAPSKYLSERINWIISIIPHRISKILFV